MELRSSRSRSKTPLLKEETTRVTRSTTYKTYEEVSQSSQKARIKSKRSSRYKTSDYSSEDGDNEVSSTHVEQISRLEQQNGSSNGAGAGMLALKIYRDAREYWNRYPKTDYTYSPHSKDRVEIAPGVINMPNMSRKSIHEMCDTDVCNKETNTECHTEQTRFRPRALFQNNNNSVRHTSHLVYHEETFIKRVFILITTTIVTILNFAYKIVEKPNEWIYSLGKFLHRLAGKVMMFDTWLLQGTESYNKKKTRAVLGLCLVPLIFLGGLWSVTALSHAFGSTENISAEIAPETKLETPLTLDNPLTKIAPSAFGFINVEPALQTEENVKPQYDLNQITDAILSSATIQNLIQNKESKAIEQLKGEVDSLKLSLELLSQQLNDENKMNMLRLSTELKSCCRRSFVQIERYVSAILKDLLSKPLHKEQILSWLNTIFVAKNDLEEHLKKTTGDLKTEYDALIENNGKRIMDEVAYKITQEMQVRSNVGDITLPTDDYIRKIVKSVLYIYDADKTGLVDYALQSSGGQVISIKCTKTYNSYTAVYSVFGIPLWYPTKQPSVVITSGVIPGECWAFQNFPGFLVIKLSTHVAIEAFSYEHVSKQLIPNGKIDSAPKNFTVHGLREENDHDAVLLGEYFYDDKGDQLQFFPVQKKDMVFDIVELRIDSNYGNPNYTCLYRFRVHGKLPT